jgi:hypothetical protein
MLGVKVFRGSGVFRVFLGNVSLDVNAELHKHLQMYKIEWRETSN